MDRDLNYSTPGGNGGRTEERPQEWGRGRLDHGINGLVNLLLDKPDHGPPPVVRPAPPRRIRRFQPRGLKSEPPERRSTTPESVARPFRRHVRRPRSSAWNLR